jgi:hypothetical protein
MEDLKAYQMSFLAADPDPHGSVSFWEAKFGSASKSKAGSGTTLKSKFRSCGGSKWSHGGLWTLTMEAWRLQLEPWMV